MEQNKLFIKNLPFSITKEKLEAVCKKVANIDCKYITSYEKDC